MPFADTCLLFNDCQVLSPCQDCFVEEVDCIFCTAPVEGRLGDNLVRIVDDVVEAACEAECKVEADCHFFTYHWSNSSLYPSTCFLLTDLMDPISPCQDDDGSSCISGSPNCEYRGPIL